MQNSDELFLFFAQVGKYAVIKNGMMGHPDHLTPDYRKAYLDFVQSKSPDQLASLSKEVFQILMKLITLDSMHDRVMTYIQVEKELRKNEKPCLNFNIDELEAKLQAVRPLFAAQYSNELKAKLHPEDVSSDLLTGTGGRIVRLKDYLFRQGPIKQIASATMTNHLGHPVQWPDNSRL